jgi:1-phosphofructokinase family hexose kinase
MMPWHSGAAALPRFLAQAVSFPAQPSEPMLPPTRLATVTLNGTLDRVIQVPDLVLGTIRNSADVLTLPGGKGLNVARTALSLGSEVMTTGLVAGPCGQWICALLESEGIPQRFVHLPAGESRVSTIIVDPKSGQSTVINDLGPSVPGHMWPQIRRQLVHAIEGYPWAILAGASLPGLPSSVWGDLCSDLQARGQRACVDTRDEWLANALPARPYVVKCNQHEAAGLVGRAVDTPVQARDAACRWIDLGIPFAIITLGRQGAVAAQHGQAWHITAPMVEALYPIGSGDAMLAGVVVGLDRGEPLPEAVRYGVALGAANTLLPGSGRCDMDALPRLLRATTIQPL